MHKDMHFYGTYSIARSAGIPAKDAYTIAYAAQFVDDSSEKNGDVGRDGSMMFGIASTHHLGQSVKGALIKRWYDELDDSSAAVMQRQIWVPFHFLPGGEGDTLEEKMICTIDSPIAQEMIDHHIDVALSGKSYGLHSLGVAAHVYMDTFAHYGFVGEGSDMNAIQNDSFKFDDYIYPESNDYLKNDLAELAENLGVEGCFNFFASKIAAKTSGNLGHGSVSTFPDRPYLNWSFEFVKNRLGKGKKSERNNQETYLQGCQRLYEYFHKFRSKRYDRNYGGREFEKIEDTVKDILSFEGGKEERGQEWCKALKEGKICDLEDLDKSVSYDPDTWESERNNLENLNSSEMVDTNIYKFHQAAALHRWFVFKELLPSHRICVL